MRVMWVADLRTECEQEAITDTENLRDGAGEGSAVRSTSCYPLPKAGPVSEQLTTNSHPKLSGPSVDPISTWA